MSTRRTSDSSTRRTLSLLIMAAGVILLLVMPLMLLVFALSGTRGAELEGTLVIMTSAGGMALVLIGAALRE